MSEIAEKSRHHKATHGLSRTRVYRIWAGMHQRCGNPKNPSWRYYGGRAFPGPVVICERWNDFSNFFADMGHPPSDAHSIGRINWREGYELSNCRWETDKEQGRSRSNVNLIRTHTGEHVLADAARDMGKNPATVAMRVFKGTPPAHSLLAEHYWHPKMPVKYGELALQLLPLTIIADEAGVDYRALHHQMSRRGLKLHEAIERCRRLDARRDERAAKRQRIAAKREALAIIDEAARKLGTTRDCIQQRLDYGWTREEAFSRPPHHRTRTKVTA